MSPMTKVFVVLTSVLSIAVSCLFISASAQWHNWRADAQAMATLRDAAITNQMQMVVAAEAALAMKDNALAEKDREIVKLVDTQRERNDEIAAQRSELAAVRSNLTASESSRTLIEEILAVTTGERGGLQKLNLALSTENTELQTRNISLNDRTLELTANVAILTDEARDLQEKLFAAEQNNAKLRTRLASAPRGTDDERGARPPVVSTVAGPIKGRIVDVDGRYASVNVGDTSGVVAGMKFMIYRGTTYLGDLVVDRVRPKEAGGRLELLSGEVRPGDPIVYDEN